MAIIVGTENPDQITPFTTPAETTGNDTIDTFGGDDTILTSGGFDIINAGSGNDLLETFLSSTTQGYDADLGDGDDIVFGGTPVASFYDLGAGNDFARLSPFSGITDTVTLGAGSDYVLAVTQGGGSLIFTDFQTGAGGDKLNFASWYYKNGQWWFPAGQPGDSGVSNPFGAGFAQLIDSAGGALLQVRSATNAAWTTIVTFMGSTAAQFHQSNFLGWDPDGSAAPATVLDVVEQSRNFIATDTMGDDEIYGTDAGGLIHYSNGNDVIYAGGGDDRISSTGGISAGKKTIYGEGGNDQISINEINGTAPNGQTISATAWGLVFGGDGDDFIGGVGGNDEFHGDAGNDRLGGFGGNDILYGGAGDDWATAGSGNDLVDGGSDNDTLMGDAGNDTLIGGSGNDSLDGGSSVDTAVFSGNRSAYTITQTSTGVFQLVGPDGTDTLTTVEYAQFADQTLRLLPGTGTAVDFNADPDTYMGAIRDFGGNNLGAGDSWQRIGQADVDGDGDLDQFFVNAAISRFAEVATGPDGLVYFSDHSWAGETRVVGIYIDPLVKADPSLAGGPFDSQTRFQNDLRIGNINGVLGAGDYDRDGLQEVYFRITDGTAFLHAYMHADGNIRYANYQNQQQVIDFLTANGWAPSTWAGWFPSGAEAPKAAGFETDSFGFDDFELTSLATIYAEAGMPRWAEDHLAMQPLV